MRAFLSSIAETPPEAFDAMAEAGGSGDLLAEAQQQAAKAAGGIPVVEARLLKAVGGRARRVAENAHGFIEEHGLPNTADNRVAAMLRLLTNARRRRWSECLLPSPGAGRCSWRRVPLRQGA